MDIVRNINIYFIILTDWKNSGMLVKISNNSSSIYTYATGWIPFDISPYLQSDISESNEEYREIDHATASNLIASHNIVDGNNYYNWKSNN